MRELRSIGLSSVSFGLLVAAIVGALWVGTFTQGERAAAAPASECFELPTWLNAGNGYSKRFWATGMDLNNVVEPIGKEWDKLLVNSNGQSTNLEWFMNSMNYACFPPQVPQLCCVHHECEAEYNVHLKYPTNDTWTLGQIEESLISIIIDAEIKSDVGDLPDISCDDHPCSEDDNTQKVKAPQGLVLTFVIQNVTQSLPPFYVTAESDDYNLPAWTGGDWRYESKQRPPPYPQEFCTIVTVSGPNNDTLEWTQDITTAVEGMIIAEPGWKTCDEYAISEVRIGRFVHSFEINDAFDVGEREFVQVEFDVDVIVEEK